MCIATLDKNENLMNTSYIGDSVIIFLKGYMIIREDDNKILSSIFVTEEHTRSFNFPY